MSEPRESTPGGGDLAAAAARERAELATTLDALARKVDVSARAKAGIRQELDRVRSEPRLTALFGVVAAGVVALLVFRRRTRRRR
ncbi:DUF3618 domain-containing protein [Rhodococcus sp. NPDC057529]|uniref:DUF3618 domain-containing protein n=1 Tax=Rhodococcus sp. NPDC057529 TaxID=3346158 RepID=UPI00366EAB32